MRAIQLYTVLLSTLFVSINAANAAIVTYEDFSSFNAATGSLTTEDFESFISDTSFDNPASPFDAGDFTLSVSASATLRNLVDAGSDSDGSNPFSGTSIDARVLVGTTVILTFDSAIEAFGATFNSLGNNTLQVLLGGNPAPGFANNLTTRFLGFVSDTPFTTVQFVALTGQNDSFFFDDVVYGSAASESAVPEPSSLALLGASGLLLIGVARRRRKETAV